MNALMKVLLHVPLTLSPISPASSGTFCSTGSSSLFQQLLLEQTLSPYSWNSATRLFSGSLGLYCSHWLRLLAQSMPGTAIGCVAPVARMALTSDCMPATLKPTPQLLPPSRQHPQERSCGSP